MVESEPFRGARVRAFGDDELVEVLGRGAATLEAEASPEVLRLLASRAGGDARAGLQMLELAYATTEGELKDFFKDYLV